MIVLDRDPKFTSLFRRHFFRKVETKLTFSMAFHSQKDGQIVTTLVVHFNLFSIFSTLARVMSAKPYMYMISFPYHGPPSS